ncbi:GapA-binding peptide SR1P [Aneurinibacillus sp. Ricciae_BoGa-3]|nr:GapA-binding peptide SR1P [Aneurinibacillus sp. Ricciae_BoGa-3]WCK53121.1 GapA-binding peptide SR1P [Aneurinibacillus sp. Ricciae_BoGa-3]
MVTVVCQQCEGIIEHYEFEKVDTLYGVCPDCGSRNASSEDK